MSTIGSTVAGAPLSSLQMRREVERAGRGQLLAEAGEPVERPGSFQSAMTSAASAAAERTNVNLSIDFLSARTFNASVPIDGRRGAGGPIATPPQVTGGSSGLSAALENMDPKLAQGIESLLEFIRQQDPDAAAALEDSLQQIFGQRSGSEAPSSFGVPGSSTAAVASSELSTQAGSFQTRAENVRIAVEMTYSQLQAQSDEGVSLTAESVRITFEANFAQITNFQRADPLVLDLDGNSQFDTTDVFNGHFFDLLGNGTKVQAATVSGGDGYLALDRNGNGIIDDGKELFGDQHGAEEGFAELEKFDENGDGIIDANDSVFSRLLIFRDANLNGTSEAEEITRLSDYGITSISLQSTAANDDSNGNLVARVGSFTRGDGSQGRAGDLLLNYLA